MPSMKIHAFQGFRYTPTTGDPGLLAAPPFDQIDDQLRDRLHAASRHQFAHLTRPSGQGVEAAQRSREIHDAWQQDGIVARDAEPSLYPYAIVLQDGQQRLGLCCLVSVLPGSESDLRPHEHTVDKPLAERLALLEATRVDYEPVFYLADDDGDLERALAQDVATLEPVVRHLDTERGEEHRLYRVSEPGRIARYRTLLATRGAAIADGHHRTKVAQLFAGKHQAGASSAAGAKMAVLTSVCSAGLVIDPIHRAVTAELPFASLASIAVARAPFRGSSGAELAQAVASAQQPAIGVWLRGHSPEIWTLDPDDVPPETPGRAAKLPVVLLHHQLYPAAGLEPAATTDGTTIYRPNPDAIWRLLESKEAAAGFWLPPMSAEAFALATQDGSVLPPKSTRFLPKLVSGLVWCGHDADLA
jgi:uncharacterized protein (DUF1015 family)